MYKIKLSWFLIFFSLVFLSDMTMASANLESSVLDVGIDSAGEVFVDLANAIPEAGCVNAQLVILASETYKMGVLTIALAAKTAGARIIVKTNGCNGTVPIISSAGVSQGYFLAK